MFSKPAFYVINYYHFGDNTLSTWGSSIKYVRTKIAILDPPSSCTHLYAFRHPPPCKYVRKWYKESTPPFLNSYKRHAPKKLAYNLCHNSAWLTFGNTVKVGSRHKNWCMTRVLSFLIRYFSNYYTLHRSDLAARATPLDPRLTVYNVRNNWQTKRS